MGLTKEQSQKFLERYLLEYRNDFDESLKECSKRIINIGIIGDEKEHEKKRKLIIKEILGKDYNKLYKIRNRGKETIGEKAFNSLRLNYGPKFIKQ